MSNAVPAVWCADLLVPVNPCGEAADATAEGSAYPVKNDLWDSAGAALSLAGATNEVVMFQLVVEGQADEINRLRFRNAQPLQVEVFQNVAVPMKDRWCDDALVPVGLSDAADSVRAIAARALPVPGRRRQTFTVEIYIPKRTKPGEREFTIDVRAGRSEVRLNARLTVHAFELPDEPACTADINNYSRSPANGFDGALDDPARYLRIERAYFREARKHRAMFHLLPYMHCGRIEPGFAPVLEGRGKARRVADWAPFDKHWGAYLDGAAYRGIYSGWDWPVEYLYTPVNLNWPAYFENFGRPGYEVEFRNVLGEIAAHLAQKKWTRTKFEVFFNHKTAGKYYPWDMDETHFDRDNYALEYFARMTNEVAARFPRVKIINRIDSSWIFDKCARGPQADLIQLWVVNAGSHSNDPDGVRLLRRRGREVWFYLGAGPVDAANRLADLRSAWIAWGRETDGFCWWNGVGWGSWEKPGRSMDYCLYPGARFGIEAPLAGIRLKVLHRGMQDHAYLTLLTRKTGSRKAADRIVGRTVGCRNREDWYERREQTGSSGTEIQVTTTAERPWNTAPVAAWNAARTLLAKAIERP